jgi:hypothetical protein
MLTVLQVWRRRPRRVRRATLRVARVALAAASLSCGSAPQTPSGPDRPLPLTRLRSEPYSYTYNSSLREPQRSVIRDRAAWQELWSAMWRGHSPPPPIPDIDFSQEMVVVVALGERPTGGFSIFVESASESPSGVAVRVRSVSPGSSCGTTQALTQPADIGRLPRRDGPVTFAEQTAVEECR